jgi:hypothetical protein
MGMGGGRGGVVERASAGVLGAFFSTPFPPLSISFRSVLTQWPLLSRCQARWESTDDSDSTSHTRARARAPCGHLLTERRRRRVGGVGPAPRAVMRARAHGVGICDVGRCSCAGEVSPAHGRERDISSALYSRDAPLPPISSPPFPPPTQTQSPSSSSRARKRSSCSTPARQL